MTTIDLAYGRSGLTVDLPGAADVIEPRQQPGLADEAGALRRALRAAARRPPLRELVRRGASVAVVVCDVTRPFPAARVLPVLLEELDPLGPGTVTVFVATGTHRRARRPSWSDARPEVLAALPGRAARRLRPGAPP